MKVLDGGRLGLADFRGNRQYVTLGNMASDSRVALFFMDYPGRTRLKLLGRMRAVPGLAAALVVEGYDARVERGLVVDVEAFDWNCPQHITPRFTAAEVLASVEPLRARIRELEAELARLRH